MQVAIFLLQRLIYKTFIKTTLFSIIYKFLFFKKLFIILLFNNFQFPSSHFISSDKNIPKSLLDVINMELTLSTRPRIWSGVFNCTMVPRMTTLMPSSIPLITNNPNDSQYNWDKPKPMIQRPKPRMGCNDYSPKSKVNDFILARFLTKNHDKILRQSQH